MGALVIAQRGHLPLGRPGAPLRPHPSPPRHAPPVVGEKLARNELWPGRYLSSRTGRTAGVAPGRREMPEPPSPLLCRSEKGATPLNTRGRRGSATRKRSRQPIRRRRAGRASDVAGSTDVSPPRTRDPAGRPQDGGGDAAGTRRGRRNRRAPRMRTARPAPSPWEFAPPRTLARAVSARRDVLCFSLSVMALKVAKAVGASAKAVLRPALLCRSWEVREESGLQGQPRGSPSRVPRPSAGPNWGPPLPERPGA